MSSLPLTNNHLRFQQSEGFFIPIASVGLIRQTNLAEFFGCALLPLKPWQRKLPANSVILGWGNKPSGHRAAALAEKLGATCWRLEDGFLRSLGLGYQCPPLSIVADDTGIYYDATRTSALERYIAEPLTEAQTRRALALQTAWCEAGVSKYNHKRDYSGELPGRYVLVVDQTYGDASIRDGLANAASFQQMLEAALNNHPDATVLLKIHPDVWSGKKRGHFDPATLQANSRIQVLTEDTHPARLLKEAEAVYCVTSQMGFEGLLHGKSVYTFGMPFYAGWGLTTDALPAPERRGTASLAQLIRAALIAYPRYRHPETGKACTPEALVEWMGLQRQQSAKMPPRVYAVGYSYWKKPIVRRFFQCSDVIFTKQQADVPKGETIAAWGRAAVPDDYNVIRLEDGFIRSVGLGADLVQPLSWVRDRKGIYYDARQPSELEDILQHHDFTEAEQQRGAALAQQLVEQAITKYNLASAPWQRPNHKRVILVPGQVETDASIRYGTTDIKTNIGLLRAVRTQAPEAYILYKPHPDVVAGLRNAGRGENAAQQYCDQVLLEADMAQLLTQVDEVHTLTSLTGFEALLRGIKVTCYGQPFYAGWGLTTDTTPNNRRTRRLSLNELIAGTLIHYPTYISRNTGHYTTPENALKELIEWRKRPQTTPLKKALQPIWRKLIAKP
ncbi:MAG: capsular polysaccharide biosynthesis protein [Saccharospirillum sp.]|nr:capsular polysaccharide biosynthesis protein [Saccharospirillum sp.]